MKILANISRILLGLVFLFSGFVKAIDPLGTAYKIEDYFIAFGGIFEQLTWIALPASIFLSTFEFLLGGCMFFNVKPKITPWLTLLMMVCMTPLTLYIAIANPVSDCGCFGDAIILDNWTTFYKNLVLLALVVIVLVYNKKNHPTFLPKIEWSIAGIFAFIPIALSVYCLLTLPIIDFRPYKVGVNIEQAMEIPEDAEFDQYETTFIYQKDGVEKEFTLADYPQNDSTWTFVRQNTKLIKKGFVPPIHDFSIVTESMDDITYDILQKQGYTVLVIMYDLNKSSKKQIQKLNVFYEQTVSQGVEFYALTGSSSQDIENFRQATNASYPICSTDPVTLKTIVRANPGMLLIKDGVIIKKWNIRTLKEESYADLSDILCNGQKKFLKNK